MPIKKERFAQSLRKVVVKGCWNTIEHHNLVQCTSSSFFRAFSDRSVWWPCSKMFQNVPMVRRNLALFLCVVVSLRCPALSREFWSHQGTRLRMQRGVLPGYWQWCKKIAGSDREVPGEKEIIPGEKKIKGDRRCEGMSRHSRPQKETLRCSMAPLIQRFYCEHAELAISSGRTLKSHGKLSRNDLVPYVEGCFWWMTPKICPKFLLSIRRWFNHFAGAVRITLKPLVLRVSLASFLACLSSTQSV